MSGASLTRTDTGRGQGLGCRLRQGRQARERCSRDVCQLGLLTAHHGRCCLIWCRVGSLHTSGDELMKAVTGAPLDPQVPVALPHPHHTPGARCLTLAALLLARMLGVMLLVARRPGHWWEVAARPCVVSEESRYSNRLGHTASPLCRLACRARRHGAASMHICLTTAAALSLGLRCSPLLSTHPVHPPVAIHPLT